ncbi:MAG: hypothetical protein LLF94_07795 [Chlamydiales bacterium]|nr:hypothetical protein [Chlamydiales bacterium]
MTSHLLALANSTYYEMLVPHLPEVDVTALVPVAEAAHVLGSRMFTVVSNGGTVGFVSGALISSCGVQMAPTIMKRVISGVLEQAIIGSFKLTMSTGVAIVCLPYTIVKWACSGPTADQLRIEELDEEIVKLKNEKDNLITQNTLLQQKIAKLKTQRLPKPVVEKEESNQD